MTPGTTAKRERVLVAMSGGVDSSTTAALLVEQGYDVLGVHMSLWDYSDQTDAGTCCSPADAQDARRVADALGIPFYVGNYRERFKTEVVDYFIREYQNGRTPNPCLKCNEHMKFTDLLRRARELGATLATGHYARIEKDAAGYALHRSRDRAKDQTYFLFSLTQEELRHVAFPLGEMTKGEVRAHAARFDLPVSTKPESQDICFVGKRAAGEFVAAHAPDDAGTTPGDIVDTQGNVLGTHKGLVHYTVGQRKGLGVAHSEPLFVRGCNAATNEITVGPANAVSFSGLVTAAPIWVNPAAIPAEGDTVAVQVRYRATPVQATVRERTPSRLVLEFSELQRAVASGQAAVLYDGDRVIGGGYIDEGLPA